MQTDDDLNGVATPHYAVGAQCFKHLIALGFTGIDQGDPQPGGAVIHAFDIARAAQRVEETNRLTLADVRPGSGCGCGSACGLVICFGIEADFALFAPRRF